MGRVYGVEPNLETSEDQDIELVNIEEAIQYADIVVVLVKHTTFDNIAFKDNQRIIDFVGLTTHF